MGWVAKAVSYAGDHPCSYPAALRPAGRPRPLPRGLRQRPPQRAVADRRPDPGRRRGRAGVLGAVDRRAQAEVRRRAARRRLDLLPRQRAGAVGRHPPRLPPPAHDVRRAAGPSRATSRWPSRTPTRARPRSARPSGAGRTTSARPPTTSTRAASRPRRTAPRTAAPSCPRGTSSSSPPTSSRPAAGCSTTSTCTTTRRARYSPVTDVTRPLWDTGYTDPSWIGAKIGLVPRMRAWVRDNYPGTKLGISEYNLGLGVTSDPRLQNVIQADALGIFGREGLDLATFWPDGGSPVPAAAFRIFRNYDGQAPRLRRPRRLGPQRRPAPGLGLRRPRRQARGRSRSWWSTRRRPRCGPRCGSGTRAPAGRPRPSSTPAAGSAGSAPSGSATTRVRLTLPAASVTLVRVPLRS